MFLVDDFFKKILDVTVDYFKYKINNSIKIKVNCINVVDSNSGNIFKGIEIVNNSKNQIIINDLKVIYNFLLDDNIKKLMEYQELTWLKINLNPKNNHIYIFLNYETIINTNADDYFYISLQVDNKKKIRKKIKYKKSGQN